MDSGGSDPYAVLGISPGASREEIQAAYIRLVKQCHPDTKPHLGESGRQEAEERFKKITEAYEALGGKTGKENVAGGAPGGGRGFGEIIDEILRGFWGGFGRQEHGSGHGTRGGYVPPSDTGGFGFGDGWFARDPFRKSTREWRAEMERRERACDYDGLARLAMALPDEVQHDIRVEAGIKAADGYAKDLKYKELDRLMGSAAPSEVNSYAREKFVGTVRAVLDRCMGNSDADGLIDVIRSAKCYMRIGEEMAKEAWAGAVRILVAQERYDYLLSLAMDTELDRYGQFYCKSRVEAGLEAVRGFEKKRDYRALKQIWYNYDDRYSELPQEVKSAAFKALHAENRIKTWCQTKWQDWRASRLARRAAKEMASQPAMPRIRRDTL